METPQRAEQRGQLIHILHKCNFSCSTLQEADRAPKSPQPIQAKALCTHKGAEQICICSHSQARPYVLPAELSHYNMWKGEDKQPVNSKTSQFTSINKMHFQCQWPCTAMFKRLCSEKRSLNTAFQVLCFSITVSQTITPALIKRQAHPCSLKVLHNLFGSG